MTDLIKKIKRCLCYPENGGLYLRKELKVLTREDLDQQWLLLNELQQKVEKNNPKRTISELIRFISETFTKLQKPKDEYNTDAELVDIHRTIEICLSTIKYNEGE